jgi:hypothetical protein
LQLPHLVFIRCKKYAPEVGDLTQEITPVQMFQARQLLHITRVELAKRISARAQSVREYEVQGLVSPNMDLQTARAALEASGAVFPENGSAGDVRLRKNRAP